MKRPISSYILIFLLLFQLLGAIPSGFSLVVDPSGKTLGLPLDLLEQSPFTDYRIPGLFLFIALGLFPGFIFWGLIARPGIKWTPKLNLEKEYHWSLSFSYYLGILLVLWINMQLLFGIAFHILHFMYSVLGVLIIIFSQWPSTKRYYSVGWTPNG